MVRRTCVVFARHALVRSEERLLPEVTRPVVRWFGGKWKLAPWVIAHFPAHRIYVEPYGGGGSVLLRKERSYAEVYNDLDGGIVNLFRVLRDDALAARLVEQLRLTPFSRTELTGAYEASEDPVERARRLIVLCFQGHGGNAHSNIPTGFRANSNKSGTTPAHDWVNYPEALPFAIERLRGVVVENRPAVEIMAQHDTADTLHYLDPPYVHDTRARGRKRDYNHEMTDADHATMLDGVQQLAGMVVLSGYPHPLYDAALAGWRRVERTGPLADGARERTEVLWINPAAAARLEAGPLFAAAS
jgi:DNA adenine methylase